MASVNKELTGNISNSPESQKSSFLIRKSPSYQGPHPVRSERPSRPSASRFINFETDPLYNFRVMIPEKSTVSVEACSQFQRFNSETLKHTNPPLILPSTDEGGEEQGFSKDSLSIEERALKHLDFNSSSLSNISFINHLDILQSVETSYVNCQDFSQEIKRFFEPSLPVSDDELPDEGARQQVVHPSIDTATKSVKFHDTRLKPKVVCQTIEEMTEISLTEHSLHEPSLDINPVRSHSKLRLSELVNSTVFPDVTSPIYTKIVLCALSGNSLEILKSFGSSGYLSTAGLEYSEKGHRGAAPKRLHLNLFLSKKVSLWLSSHSISWVTCGFEHALILTSEGVLMSWGSGQSGCLGSEQTQNSEYPRVISALQGVTIVYVEAGAYHNAAIAAEGCVYTWGRNDVHQTGLPSNHTQRDQIGLVVREPTKVSFFNDKKVVGVACGEAHTLVLDSEGRVYSFGWAEDGQLGLPSNELLNNIIGKDVKRIRALDSQTVLKVAAGALFSCCVSNEGQVYVWGNGQQGQLGLDKGVVFEDFPKPVALNEKVVDVACGKNHVICLTHSGNVYGWGMGTAGDFEVYNTYEKGTDLACFLPQKLSSLDIAQRHIIMK